MVYPAGIVTKTLTVGVPSVLESGDPALVTVSVKANRGLTWQGNPLVTQTRVVSPDGVSEVVFELPVCDLVGMRDDRGNPIDLDADQVTHTYTATLTFRDEYGALIDTRQRGPFAIYQSSPPIIDLDVLLADGAMPGAAISVPDVWSGTVDGLVERTNAAIRRTDDAVAAADTATKVAQAVVGELPQVQAQTLDTEWDWLRWRLRQHDLSLGLLAGVQGLVTLTNTALFPFNNSGATVAISGRSDTDYCVLVEVVSESGGQAGDFVVTNKTATNFKVAYTGSAESVVAKYRIR